MHELVARSSAWQVRATNGRAKVYSFALPAISIIPRVRTYHTKKPSRFVHALSARPLKVQGGREFSLYADGIIKISPISLCSHQDTHPNLNREVRHSLTWHSSKSESALERFEPVAAAMLWSDGRGTLFALVAARRQGVFFKRGELTHTRSVCVGVAETGGKPSYMTFGTFGHAKVREKKSVFIFLLGKLMVSRALTPWLPVRCLAAFPHFEKYTSV